MISQKAKYALRALVVLARAESSVMIGTIAEEHNIPRRFLEQILLELKHHGLVVSHRGRLGGYALLRPADQITFGQVLRIVDGPIAPLPCLSRIAYRRCEDCQSEQDCEIRRVFSAVADSMRDVLDHAIRVRDQVGSLDELLSSILQASLARSSLADNEDMRKISAYAGIIAVPTAIAGIYGMNFEHMPELDWRFGYPVVLLVILSACVLLYRGFKRNGWL